jgi:hypothetical protein
MVSVPFVQEGKGLGRGEQMVGRSRKKIRNPKLEIRNKFKIQMTERGGGVVFAQKVDSG